MTTLTKDDFLPEQPVWEDGVYMLKETDPVLGGPTGVDNLPLKHLANRTLFLKGEMEKGGEQHKNAFIALAKADGFRFIGQAESIEQLRTIRPTEHGQRILVKSYYVGGTTGGGEFVADLQDLVTPDDGGTCFVVEQNGGRWKRLATAPLTVADFGAVEGYNDGALFAHADKANGLVLNGDYATNKTFDSYRLKGQGSLLMGNGQSVSASGAGLANAPFYHKLLTNLQIEDGYLMQGMARVVHQNIEKLFMVAVTKNTTNVEERAKIYEYHLNDTSSDMPLVPVATSQQLNIGHANNLSAEVVDDVVYLLTTSSTLSDNDMGKGIAKIKWQGSATSQAQVQELRLFDASSHLINGTYCVSQDGRWVIAAVHDSKMDWYKYETLIYLREQLEKGNKKPMYRFDMPLPQEDDLDVLQGIASDGRRIYVYSGYFNALEQHLITVFDFAGNKIKEIPVTTALSQYSETELLNHSQGIPFCEPQGIALIGDDIYVGCYEKWFAEADIVTYNGQNYACIAKNTQGISPEYSRRWVRTNKHATRGEYNPATLYFTSESHYAKVVNSVYALTQQAKSGYELMPRRLEQKKIQKRDMYFGMSNIRVKRHSPQLQATYNYLEYLKGGIGLFDSTYGADNNKMANVQCDFANGNEVLFLRSKNTLNEGAGINLYGENDSSAAGQVRIYALDTQNDNRLKTLIFRGKAPAFYPSTNGEISLGIGALRFSQVYAANGTISTSDERLKQDIKPITDEVIEAWRNVNFCAYRWRSAVAEKGEKARYHLGLLAQQIKLAFEQKGLNACDYGLLCYDEWQDEPEIRDEEGNLLQPAIPAGNRWSIRAEECLFLEAESLRRRLETIEQRLAKLESE